MEKLDLTCPKCNGIMDYIEEKNEIICPYCGHKEVPQKKESIEDLAARTMQESYAREKGKQIAEEEKEKREKRKKFKFKIISILVLIILFILVGNLMQVSKEYVEDPFSLINVEFTGKNGSGYAKITILDKSKSNIKYTLSKSEKLSENEIITVSVTQNSDYRFGTNSKQYTVKGLAQYVNNLENLDNSIKEEIHGISYEFLKRQLEDTYSFNGTLVELAPYKIYLLTNSSNSNYNILYDVYTAKIQAKSGNSYDKCLVIYYENLIVLPNNKWSYDKKASGGSIVAAGDPATMNGLSKDYAGYLKGFLSIDDFEMSLKEHGGIYGIITSE